MPTRKSHQSEGMFDSKGLAKEISKLDRNAQEQKHSRQKSLRRKNAGQKYGPPNKSLFAAAPNIHSDPIFLHPFSAILNHGLDRALLGQLTGSSCVQLISHNSHHTCRTANDCVQRCSGSESGYAYQFCEAGFAAAHVLKTRPIRRLVRHKLNC